MRRSFKLHPLIFSLALISLMARAQAPNQTNHSTSQPQSASSRPDILLLAHGGSDDWNNEVNKLAQATDKACPTEVAFGMATKSNMEAAIHRLASRGVSEIIAVPLFISSHSSVVSSSQYLLGLISEAPPDLVKFARMSHGHGAEDHSAHNSDPTKPIDLPVPVRMTSALGRHPLVAGILLSRAQSISQEPREETVVLVAHGPVSDVENARWLADMSSLAEQMKSNGPFRDIRFMTVRDDAPAPIRDQATAELRKLIESVKAEKRRALVVPLLLSYGGIEPGVKKRLEGLEYTITNQALLPDDRLIEWVLTSTREALSNAKVVGK
jgi:sirohydrochlorin ferrochelatase